jgi:uncharacterized protein
VRFPGHVGRLFGPAAGSVRLLREVAVGVGHGLAGFLVINLGIALLVEVVTRAAGGDIPEPQVTLREALTRQDTALLAIITTVVLAPFAEELFFRGMVFQALRRRFWLWPAVGWSAVLFALGHLQVGDMLGSLLVFVIVFPFSFYLAIVFERRGTLVAPIAMHLVFNGLGVIAIVSGVG